MQGQYRICTGDPCIDGDHPRLMQTIRRQQKMHKDPLTVSEVGLCEFMSPKCICTCLQEFGHVWTCLCVFVGVVGPLPVFLLQKPCK
jgi:hypothetical protein